MNKDIVLYYFFSFFLGFYIANGTTVLFARVLEFSYAQIFTMSALYMLMFIIFEVPSGALADLLGRKKIVALGCLLLVLGALATGMSSTFPQVLASFLLWAAGFSCISGARQALLYDRLKDEMRYSKILGRSVMIGLLGTILAGVIGPQLYEINFRYPYLFSAIPFAIGGVAILFFSESRPEQRTFTLKHHFAQMAEGAKTTFHNRHIRWSMFVLALTFAAMYTMSNAYQPYLQAVGFSVMSFSVILPVMFLFEGLGGLISGRFLKAWNENAFFWIVAIALGVSIILLGAIPFKATVIALMVYMLAQGFAGPLISVYANRHIASHQRATVLSVQGMISTLAAAIPLFGFGFLSDRFGLMAPLAIFGGIILIVGLGLVAIKPGNT